MACNTLPYKIAALREAHRHDGAVELRSGRKNGFAEVEQKNAFVGKSRANIS